MTLGPTRPTKTDGAYRLGFLLQGEGLGFFAAAIFPAMLVIAQPDLGSGLVYMAIATAILFVGGTKWTHFVVLGVTLLGSSTVQSFRTGATNGLLLAR